MPPVDAASSLPVLAAGIERAQVAQAGAAQRIATEGPDVASIVDLSMAGQALAASAVAFSSIAETERTLIDVFA